MAERRATNYHGCPVASLTAGLSVAKDGPLLFQDTNLLEHLAAFDRERIPERVVHAKGGGAFGEFVVTHDITQYTKAKLFSEIGKRTPVAARFSTVGGESGSADTARDPRGFAIKFYTEDGNYDIVGNNTPVFFIRDAIFFPSFIHTQKRLPGSHLKDANMFWDFLSLRAESTHQVTFLFGDRGTPDGFRHMHGFGSHTFKMVNAAGDPIYVKFHWVTNQGIKNLPAEEADLLAGTDPDYAIRDLYDAITREDFPSWTLNIQVMTFEQAEEFEYNPFDVTKVWPHGDYPLHKVGVMTLNRNPENYFAEIEQLAFSPANFVPGIEASPDRMLQGRLFSYVDTHRHRLGANYAQLPVNRPIATVETFTRDGPMTYINQGPRPNYFPNSFDEYIEDPFAVQSSFNVTGDAIRYDTGLHEEYDNFTQVNNFWTDVIGPEERQRLVNNIARHLKGANTTIQDRTVGNFTQVNPEFGRMLREALDNAKRSISGGVPSARVPSRSSPRVLTSKKRKQ